MGLMSKPIPANAGTLRKDLQDDCFVLNFAAFASLACTLSLGVVGGVEGEISQGGQVKEVAVNNVSTRWYSMCSARAI
jgi:hypothetical protein